MNNRIIIALGAAAVFIAAPGSASAFPQSAAQASAMTMSQAGSLQAERADDPKAAPARREGEGPYTRLIVRGVTLIDGTGALKLNDKTGKPEQVSGVKWTIKDGIVYDAKKLLADVNRMVEDQKKTRPAADAVRPR